MKVVKILPTNAQITPAVTPPMRAGRSMTRVFGTNAYMQVNAMVTMTYGTSRPSADMAQASGGISFSHCANGLCSAAPKSPTTTASSAGPTIMTDRNSVKRRAKLRGRWTRQT